MMLVRELCLSFRCRHSTDLNQIPLLECLMCAAQESLKEQAGHEEQCKLIDAELEKTDQIRVSVLPDGHCIVRAAHKVLSREHCYPITSYKKLLQSVIDEIEENRGFYSEKIPDDTDVLRDLELYKNEKQYSQDTVDLVLYCKLYTLINNCSLHQSKHCRQT